MTTEERVGICGNRATAVIGGLLDVGAVCDLPAGHAGWHGADNPPSNGSPPSRMSWSVDDQGPIFGLSTAETWCDLHAKEHAAEGESRGWQRAVAALREIGRDAHDGAPFQNIADAIADVSYVGKQVTRGHGRYLADAAILALIDHLESIAATQTPGDQTDGR